MAAKVAALILAAGQGKRMRSSLPKVLHLCGELPLVAHAVRLALARRCDPIVVVISPEGQRVRDVLTALFPAAPLRFAVQRQPLGTGDAARVGLAAIARHTGNVLLLYGDVPLLRPATVARLQRALRGASLALLTATVSDPRGYGRVIRNGARVLRIVEHQDAGPKQRSIHEINVGVYLCAAALLRRTTTRLTRKNRQAELYLTDVVALAAEEKGAVPVVVDDPEEVRGVNSQAELALAEASLRRRIIAAHQARGVVFRDPRHTFVGPNVRIAPGVVIGMGVQLEGRVKIGRLARVEGPTVIKDSRIEGQSIIHAFSHLEGATVRSGASVGPYARLRPGAYIDQGAKVGNFVELKKTRLGRGAKAPHLTYLGDASIGARVNVGAGTITCNYDGGPVKHPTRVGAGAFIGSNATLVAPVAIGAGAYVAAGSTITKHVPAQALAFGRARQENRRGYARKVRARQRRGRA